MTPSPALVPRRPHPDAPRPSISSQDPAPTQAPPAAPPETASPLRPVLEEALALAGPCAEAAGLRLRLDPDCAGGAYADPALVRQVVGALIRAEAHAAAGPATLTARCVCGCSRTTLIRLETAPRPGAEPSERAVSPALAAARGSARRVLGLCNGGLTVIPRPDGGHVTWLSLPKDESAAQAFQHGPPRAALGA